MPYDPALADLLHVITATMICCRAKKCRADDGAAVWYNEQWNVLVEITMKTLLDGREWYEKSDLSFWNFTRELEKFAAKMKQVIARGDRVPGAVRFADLLLRAIELWKAGSTGADRMGCGKPT